MIEQFRFSSDDLPEEEAFDRYRELYASGADVTRGQGPFRAQVSATRLDRIILFHRQLSGVVHARQARVHADGFDHFVVTLVVSGSQIIYMGDTGPVVAYAGDVILTDMQKPSHTEIRDAVLVTASVARDLMEAALGSQLATAHGHIVTSPRSDVLADFMASLAHRAPTLDPAAVPGLCRAFIQILGAAWHSARPSPRSQALQQELAQRDAVDRYLALHLSDRSLSAESLGAAVGLSRSALYRLFERQGGVSRYIQAVRLDALRAALDDGVALPLATLATAHGFATESHMSRAFSTTYGTSPGAYRMAALAGAEGRRIELARRRWNGWMMKLD